MLSTKTTRTVAAAAAATARPPPRPSKTTERLEKQRKTFEHAHALLVGQRERLEQLERTRMDADVARLVMRKHMVQEPHPEPSGEMREMYWAAVSENVSFPFCFFFFLLQIGLVFVLRLRWGLFFASPVTGLEGG